ncbi:hypothetical protein ABEB36_006714 [Hypothenemus hampei]|uniref:Uncharacterized protein n=1 Tax=Hypothenemus hampei TaxID=57062 RepID=A0ABD1ES91_HYPHA
MDDISDSILKQLPTKAKNYLPAIYDKYLKENDIPNSWRKHKVVNTPKPETPEILIKNRLERTLEH